MSPRGSSHFLSSSLPIKCSVILSLIFIHGIVLAVQSQQTAEQNTNQLTNNKANLMNRVGEPQQLPMALIKKSAAGLERDDYHTNIDLDKLNPDTYRYEMLDGGSRGGGAELYSSDFNNNDQNPLKSETLINKLISRFARDQYYVNGAPSKRFSRYYPTTSSLANNKEDKDYTFVGGTGGGSVAPDAAQQRASVWAENLMRDLVQQLAAQNRLRNNNLVQLTPASSNSYLRFGLSKNEPQQQQQQQLADNNIVPQAYREKRRRCKVDPNLGVKNPSFCDTDAYFGAADYSMRDVWDSAGKRR